MMLTAKALLGANPNPTPQEIREAICGTSCRCTGYENIVRSIRWAAEHDITAMQTGNAHENAAMLALNATLGYRPVQTETHYLRDH